MYLQNNTQNLLAFGPNETTRSDHRIFNSDGGKTIQKLADSNDYFLATCSSLLERLINTVPDAVELSEVISEPIPVKPSSISANIDPLTGNMNLLGEIRVCLDLQLDAFNLVEVESHCLADIMCPPILGPG
jgi:hypothetical protein